MCAGKGRLLFLECPGGSPKSAKLPLFDESCEGVGVLPRKGAFGAYGGTYRLAPVKLPEVGKRPLESGWPVTEG